MISPTNLTLTQTKKSNESLSKDDSLDIFKPCSLEDDSKQLAESKENLYNIGCSGFMKELLELSGSQITIPLNPKILPTTCPIGYLTSMEFPAYASTVKCDLDGIVVKAL